jgi:hypothetical protein
LRKKEGGNAADKRLPFEVITALCEAVEAVPGWAKAVRTIKADLRRRHLQGSGNGRIGRDRRPSRAARASRRVRRLVRLVVVNRGGGSGSGEGMAGCRAASHLSLQVWLEPRSASAANSAAEGLSAGTGSPVAKLSATIARADGEDASGATDSTFDRAEHCGRASILWKSEMKILAFVSQAYRKT